MPLDNFTVCCSWAISMQLLVMCKETPAHVPHMAHACRLCFMEIVQSLQCCQCDQRCRPGNTIVNEKQQNSRNWYDSPTQAFTSRKGQILAALFKFPLYQQHTETDMPTVLFKLRQQRRPATYVHVSSLNNAASCCKNMPTLELWTHPSNHLLLTQRQSHLDPMQ